MWKAILAAVGRFILRAVFEASERELKKRLEAEAAKLAPPTVENPEAKVKGLP